MKWRLRYFVPASVGLVLIGVGIRELAQPPEPTYQGKTVSYWLQALKGDDTSLIAGLKAFHAIGPNGISFIVARGKKHDSALCNAARDGWDRLPLFFKRFVPRPTEPLIGEAGQAMAAVGPDAIPSIIDLLRDRHEGIRLSSLEALKVFCGQDSVIKAVVPELFRDLHDSDMKPAIPELIRALRDPSADVREGAAAILGQLGLAASQAVDNLIDGLRDSGATRDGPLLMVRGTNECLYGTVRAACAQALGKIGPPAKRAIPTLTGLLHDANVDARIKAIVALRRLGYQITNTVPLLLEALKTFPDERRVEPTSAIVEMELGAEEILPLLFESLKIDSPALQRLVTESLKKTEDPAKVLPALTLLLDDPNSRIRANAAETLGAYGPVAKSVLPKLILLASAADSYERYIVGNALRQIDPGAAAEAGVE